MNQKILFFLLWSSLFSPLIFAQKTVKQEHHPNGQLAFETTYVDAINYFVDEQRVGPYAIWHHEHHFKEIDGGVEMLDRVYYKVPLGILGKLVHPLIVKPKLEEIFDFRVQRVEELFGKWEK